MHDLVKAPIVPVWDRLNTHVSHAMRHLINEWDWLTVFLLPTYAPELNPVEYLWAHVKHSLANLASTALDRLEALARNRLRRLQYRSNVLDGFLVASGKRPPTRNLGADYCTRRDPERSMRRMTSKTNRLGLTVRFQPIPAA
ncbi:transposase [Streptomyces sp. CG1]|uniref:transposase n=1 Tax=Streptomyces sp. CG1 TaxID=1287523 RepID=UPI0034E1CF4C